MVENCGLAVTKTAELIKVSPMAVSLCIRRLKEKLESDKRQRDKIEGLSLK